jgi:hypothetical protein
MGYEDYLKFYDNSMKNDTGIEVKLHEPMTMKPYLLCRITEFLEIHYKIMEILVL